MEDWLLPILNHPSLSIIILLNHSTLIHLQPPSLLNLADYFKFLPHSPHSLSYYPIPMKDYILEYQLDLKKNEEEPIDLLAVQLFSCRAYATDCNELTRCLLLFNSADCRKIDKSIGLLLGTKYFMYRGHRPTARRIKYSIQYVVLLSNFRTYFCDQRSGLSNLFVFALNVLF